MLLGTEKSLERREIEKNVLKVYFQMILPDLESIGREGEGGGCCKNLRTRMRVFLSALYSPEKKQRENYSDEDFCIISHCEIDLHEN
jgi:hypothetical protein